MKGEVSWLAIFHEVKAIMCHMFVREHHERPKNILARAELCKIPNFVDLININTSSENGKGPNS